MSNPTGHQQTPYKGQRPSFDRPSLFAGMEDDEGPEDTQRVRILSTLESTRHASKPRRTKGGRSAGSQPGGLNWLQIGLWSIMGAGVLALFAGFVLTVQDTQPAVLQAMPAPATASPVPKQHRLAPPDATTTVATAAGPAVIETTAHAAPTVVTLPSVAPQAATTPPAAPPRPMALALANDKPVAQAATKQPAAATGKPVKDAPPSAKTQDEDVALLEAMFAHTGRKTAPKSDKPKH